LDLNHISNNLKADVLSRVYRLHRLGYRHVTVHGFRSTLATWAEECTDYPDGVREAALAHKDKSETTAAKSRVRDRPPCLDEAA
jgi:integrase